MYYRQIKGNWYAYESRREGDKVRSVYLGRFFRPELLE